MACCVAASAGAEIYKWKDADGRVHYSDSPPPGVGKKAQVINTKELPVSSLPLDRGTTQPAQTAQPPAQAGAQPPAQKQAEAAKDPQACEAALKRASFLKNNKLFKAINEKGNVEFMDDEKRKRELAEIDATVKQHCGTPSEQQ
ncbi:DUF4124 domain-containing protein [Chitiniphilus purpureus]|uniref:DUF4124 domain-containing protein n=2 Tax=Chitiniphilus purpureus TaxID=2981137 RepID=A0ABY6DSG7_9NEIS|nr:DUF4124 domain-containing protein [Chitiniphilus sp. CD1]